MKNKFQVTEFLKYILFLLILFYTTYWVMISLTLTSFGEKKSPITIIENSKLTTLIKDKTNVRIPAIKISESPRLFGMMIGIPTQPQLILSRGIFESFTLSEMEYVVLHEIGHYVLWHGIIEITILIVIAVFGIIALHKIPNHRNALISAIFLGVFFGILLIQIGKIHEIQADTYAVKRISDPQGMIDATENFQNYHGTKFTLNSNPILQFLFYRSNPYENRIRIAEEEMRKR